MEAHRVTLQVGEAELASRRATLEPHKGADERGWLHIYAQVVQPITKGAVLVGAARDAAP
jgi:dihydroxy-acid dehydratase